MKIRFQTLLFISCFCFSQSKNDITFSFNLENYNLEALDSVKSILKRQKKQRLPDKEKAVFYPDTNQYGNQIYLGNHYKSNELKLITLPIFRIERSTYEIYDCDKNIEDYIVFEERLKYQRVLITNSKNKYLGQITVPDYESELDRIYSGSDMVSQLENHNVNRMFFYENSNSELLKNIQNNPDRFYFEIFGLDFFLFDIENNQIFAQYIGDCGCILLPDQTPEEAEEISKNLRTRAPINEYIKKNDMFVRLKEIALGFYITDWKNPEIKQSKKCEIEIPKPKRIFIEKANR